MIGVTETWLRPSDTQGLLDEITPAGFQLHHVPHRNKRGGGVAVFVRNDIDGVHYQTDQRDTFEHITVKLSEHQSSQLLVHIIYRPPNTSKSKFIEEFTCFMEAAALSPKPISCLILQIQSLSRLLTKQPAYYHTSIFIP